jgi:hypothetical protein
MLLRYTNFVEIMAPLMSMQALRHLMPTLDNDDIKSAWGLDFVWPYLLNNRDVAVIDKTPMTHTRPVTAFNPDSNFYRMYNIDPMLEGHQNMTKYGLSSNTKPRCFREVRLPVTEEVPPLAVAVAPSSSSSSEREREVIFGNIKN